MLLLDNDGEPDSCGVTGGGSGAPVYVNFTAYAMHRGRRTVNDVCQWTINSHTDNIQGAISVVINID